MAKEEPRVAKKRNLLRLLLLLLVVVFVVAAPFLRRVLVLAQRGALALAKGLDPGLRGVEDDREDAQEHLQGEREDGGHDEDQVVLHLRGIAVPLRDFVHGQELGQKQHVADLVEDLERHVEGEEGGARGSPPPRLHGQHLPFELLGQLRLGMLEQHRGECLVLGVVRVAELDEQLFQLLLANVSCPQKPARNSSIAPRYSFGWKSFLGS